MQALTHSLVRHTVPSMDEETLEALLAGSDDETTEFDENEGAGGSDLEDLEGEFASKTKSFVSICVRFIHIYTDMIHCNKLYLSFTYSTLNNGTGLGCYYFSEQAKKKDIKYHYKH